MTSKVEADGGFWVALALSVLLIPLKWLLAWLIAAFIHEVCHIIMLRIFHTKILRLQLRAFGARIESTPISEWSAVICTIAGPLGSLLLVLLARVFPYVAICGFLQGMCNLLPLFPMDGWHIIESIHTHYTDERPMLAVTILKVFVRVGLILLGIYFLRNALGPIPLIAAIVLIWKDLKNSLQKRDEEGTIVLLE